MDLIIREANLSDYPALCAIFAEVQALHAAALPQIFRAPDGPAISEEYVAEIIADRDAALFVAEQDAQVVGMLIIKLHEAPDNAVLAPRRSAMIHDLAVRSDCRRAGMGRALIERAQQWARDHGVFEVELIVWEFNANAIAFYQQLGYTTLSRKMSISL